MKIRKNALPKPFPVIKPNENKEVKKERRIRKIKGLEKLISILNSYEED